MSPPASSPFRIAALLGTVRPGNYTSKALALVRAELERADRPIDIFDPATDPLPLPGAAAPGPGAERLRAMVEAAAGVVIATPEYHGGLSAVSKLLIENLGFPSVLRGKPVALLGVAAGSIGAVKSLEQLRSICSHVGALVLPSAVSVARVQQVFDADGTCRDAKVERQVRGVATDLWAYVERHLCPEQHLEQAVRTG